MQSHYIELRYIKRMFLLLNSPNHPSTEIYLQILGFIELILYTGVSVLLNVLVPAYLMSSILLNIYYVLHDVQICMHLSAVYSVSQLDLQYNDLFIFQPFKVQGFK